MVSINRTLDRDAELDLERIIEPLANYICATDQPQAALRSALAFLFSEVEETNRLALAHAGAFGGDRW